MGVPRPTHIPLLLIYAFLNVLLIGGHLISKEICAKFKKKTFPNKNQKCCNKKKANKKEIKRITNCITWQYLLISYLHIFSTYVCKRVIRLENIYTRHNSTYIQKKNSGIYFFPLIFQSI